MPTWTIVLLAVEGAAILALAAAAWILGRRLDDQEALLRAAIDDARALDERATDLEDEVAAIKEHPLGPPADAEEADDEE